MKIQILVLLRTIPTATRAGVDSYTRINAGTPFSWILAAVFCAGCNNGFQAKILNQNDAKFAAVVANQTCGGAPGHVTIHRLTNTEYNNTIRDLLYLTDAPGNTFPPSVPGSSGYSNDSAALDVDDVYVGKYYAAATSLATEVLNSKGVSGGSYAQIAGCGNSTCAQSVVQTLTSRAYRRPVTTSELNALMNVYNMGASFDEGLRNVITNVLLTPKFLYVVTVNPQSKQAGAVFSISDYELASRLSYFLWQSMPDVQLTQLAAAGTLHNADTLTAQVKRMLKDAKSQSFINMLRDEWLHLDAINSFIMGLDDNLRQAMITETTLLLQDIVQNDKGFVNLFSAKYSYMNKTLADFYGLPYTSSDPSAFVKTSLGGQRQGILSHASYLTATGGMGPEPSTVRRGKAVSAQMLCTTIGPPPVPPPNLNTDPNLTGNPRQRLVQVTSSSTCMGCHSILNNSGFGLSMFNTWGQLRRTYTNYPDMIDSSGNLPGVFSYTDGHDMLQQIPNLPSLHSCFPQQVMAIATTRAAKTDDDLCIQKLIGAASSSPTSNFTDVVAGVVLSRQFTMQTGEAP